jgi:hypothetical protein
VHLSPRGGQCPAQFRGGELAIAVAKADGTIAMEIRNPAGQLVDCYDEADRHPIGLFVPDCTGVFTIRIANLIWRFR